MVQKPGLEIPTIRVLLVDDDEDDYRLTLSVTREITNAKIQLDWQPDFDTALEAICDGVHDVYLIDYRLGQKTGIDLLHALKEKKCSGPIILLTGQGEPEIDRAAQSAGAADYLEKSRLDAVVFERMIRYAIHQHNHEAELERKVVERTEELEAVNRALRDANVRKDEFLATLAHELRNPLAPIRHALELQKLIGDDPIAHEQARNVMERQLLQLVRLIDDLLDVSRLNRGVLSLNREPFDLRSAISLAVETSMPRILKAGIELQQNIPDRPLPFLGDHIRIAQVITNILNNSAKYTNRGGSISLSVERNATAYCIRVSDNGVGIPPAQLEHVFDLFTQVDRALNRLDGGLGIGLALVKWLVEMHGGTVVAESPGPQQGTTITVQLPIL